MAKRKTINTTKLPEELTIFWNEQNAREPFLQICESDEDAYVESGGGSDVIIGVYKLVKRVHLEFRVERK